MPITTFKSSTLMQDGFSVKCESRGHTIVLDEARNLGGSDSGMNPIEAALSALGACQVIVAKLYAKNKGIDLLDFKIELEGDIDTDAFNDDQRSPYIEEIRTKVFIKSSSPEEEVRKFVNFVENNCPVANILKNPAQMIPEVIIETAE
ncbi:MAG: OsmC family protein [Gammaproteobacteria bacterium]|nr:OsmC family protein [Gammaproteobacteria bacterium]